MELSNIQKKQVALFNKKIKNQYYKFQYRKCLCEQSDYHIIAKHDTFGMKQNIVFCKNCGFVYCNPQLTDESYKEFYESDEYRLIYSGADYIEKMHTFFETSGHIFELLKPICQEKELRSVLEFGCGAGWNLLDFHKDGGFSEIKGIDYSKELAEIGKEHGLDIRSGSIDQIPERKFDVIILSHVVEHLTEFYQNMGKILAHLNDNGVVYIAVPNIDDFEIGQFQNAHVSYFTPRTLDCYLNKCGLTEIQGGKSEGIHMYRILNLSTSKEGDKACENMKNEYYYMRTKVVKDLIYRRLVLLLEFFKVKALLKKLFLAK